jgi:hypothetical protein
MGSPPHSVLANITKPAPTGNPKLVNIDLFLMTWVGAILVQQTVYGRRQPACNQAHLACPIHPSDLQQGVPDTTGCQVA